MDENEYTLAGRTKEQRVEGVIPIGGSSLPVYTPLFDNVPKKLG